jgi:YHS domain-containing protein
MKRRMVVLLMIAVLVAAASVALVRHVSVAADARTTEPVETPVTPVLHEALGITPEQAAQLAQIRSQLLARVWALTAQMEPARQRLTDVMSDAAADRDAVASAVTDLSRLQAQIYEAGAEAWSAARGTLTDFQRKELTDYRKLPQGCDLCRLLYRPGLIGVYGGFDIKCPMCEMLGIPKPRPSVHQVEDELPTCPVCGREIDPKTNPPSFTYKGVKVLVCSPECAALLQQNPDAYLEEYFDQGN